MQTEIRLRLIRDNKIVGYARLVKDAYGYFPFETSQKGEIFSIAKYPLGIDAFEQGIKTPDGTYWFEGDLFMFSKRPIELINLKYGWQLKFLEDCPTALYQKNSLPRSIGH